MLHHLVVVFNMVGQDVSSLQIKHLDIFDDLSKFLSWIPVCGVSEEVGWGCNVILFILCPIF